MAYRSQPLKARAGHPGGLSGVLSQGTDGLMLGVRRLNQSGLVLHTRRCLEPGSQLALSLQVPGESMTGRIGAPVFVHVHATVAGRRVVKDSAIGRIYEVTLVFHPHSPEQRQRLGRIASEFPRGGIAVPSECNTPTGSPNPLFGLN